MNKQTNSRKGENHIPDIGKKVSNLDKLKKKFEKILVKNGVIKLIDDGYLILGAWSLRDLVSDLESQLKRAYTLGVKKGRAEERKRLIKELKKLFRLLR